MEVVKIGSNGTHGTNFKVARPNGYPYYLFLLVKTPALFIIDNEEIKVENSSVIIYDINSPHYYSAYNRTYVNDWIHCKVEGGADYFNSLNIPLNKIIKIWDDVLICEIIKIMSNEYYSINTKKHETMNLLLQTMFVKLSEVISIRKSKRHTNIHYAKLVSLRNEIYSNPQKEWKIDILASKMNMCCTYFQKIYRSTFGISCIADVIASKLNYAKDTLSRTNMSIFEIANECGYKNDVHFMRQFKKYVGVTPSEYRKNNF